ncbi:reverse transcriptase [Gossypium australe]|uniref:Reverse transcriptase n=1 Tax=Gossypium australe TaxID=47621 RepID=A0A5B6VAM7_9ROSI|nr:reverse transcriptase [Gossypium australe]
MERLGHPIHKSVDDKARRPISLRKNGPKISLFFADDLFLFTKADIEQARMIRDVLDIFGGHRDIRIASGATAKICSVLLFNATNDLGTYLGMPLLHQRVITSTFKFVIDKVQRKLDGWNAKFLPLRDYYCSPILIVGFRYSQP